MSFVSILKVIRANHSFLICTHVNPDPDALASQLALAKFLKSLGKKALALSLEQVPQRYSFLPGSGLVQVYNRNKKQNYDVCLVVDCGDLDRIGHLQDNLIPGKPLINIDHHITNKGFGTIHYVDPGASSTAEIIYELLKAAKFKMTKPVAALLYLGIMTDTGSFRFENTTQKTHRVVSELLEFPLPVNQYYQKLYEVVPLSDYKYFTRIVSQFKPIFSGQIIVLKLKRSATSKISQSFDLRDKIFQYLRAIKGVEAVVILTELGPQKTRVNLRSQGHIDVARLAQKFNGGGHSRASGCMIDGSLAKADGLICRELEKILGIKP